MIINSKLLQFQGCTDFGGSIKYWCKWSMDDEKAVFSDEAKTKFPQMVIQYLESKIVDSEPEFVSDRIRGKFNGFRNVPTQYMSQ